jgi:hypothetical protein
VNKFTLLKQDVVIKRLGGMESYINQCSETSCIVSLGKKAQVDYVAQCRVGHLGKNFRITVELYNVSNGGLLGIFSDKAENFDDLLALMGKNVPDVFRNITEQKQAIVPDKKTSNPSTLPLIKKENNNIGKNVSNRTIENSKKNPSSYYEELDFTVGERVGAILLNTLPGLGSYAVMDDFVDVVIQWGFMTVGAYVIMYEGSDDVGAILIGGGYLFGFVRPIFYDKPKPKVKVISQQKKSDFNMAILPDKHGEPKTYLFYGRRF